jgi:hypothetical protein
MQHDVQALLNEVPMHTAVNNGGPRGASWGWISSSATSNNYGGEISHSRASLVPHLVWKGPTPPSPSEPDYRSLGAVAGLPLALTMTTNPSERRICSHHHRLHHLYCTPVRWDGVTGACRSPSG